MKQNELLLEHLMIESVEQEMIAENGVIDGANSVEPEEQSLFATNSTLSQHDTTSKPLVEGKPPRAGKPSPPSARSSLARLASFGGADETLLQRAKHKSDELRVLFGLPESENLVDDYNCALYKKILLQGYTKKKVIPLESVANIHKRRNYGFPNSIEVMWGPNNKREFFTSFISRDDAYKKMLCAWDHKCPIARLVNEHVAAVVARQTEKKAQLESAQSLRSSADGLPSWVSRKISRRIRGASWQDMSRLTMSHDDGFSDDGGEIDDASFINRHSGGGQEGSLEACSDSDDEAAPAGRADATSGLREMEGPAPTLPKNMTRIARQQLPTTPRAFFQRFLADNCDFFQRFHEGRGDKHITLSKWALLTMGCVREMQFVSPLKYRIGPPEARCHQTQRYCLYGEHLVFETSQVIPEIPYGDHFSVEARWDVEPIGAEQCMLTCHVQVPFSKSTLLMPAIKKGALDSTRDAFRDLLGQVQSELAGGACVCAPPPMDSANSSSSSPQPLPVSSSLPPHSPSQALPSSTQRPVAARALSEGLGWAPVTKTLQGFLVERNNIVMLAVMFWGLCVLYLQLLILRVASKPPTVVVHAGGVDVSLLQREVADLRVQMAKLLGAQ